MEKKRELAKIYENTLGNNDENCFKNLSERVYEIIRNKIIFHEIKPGERIIDKHVADKLGVSRSLVRQVLNILEKEELIVSIPRSGFYVRKITEQDVEEIYDIRKLLETHALKLAVPEISDCELEDLEETFEEAKKDLKKDKVKKFVMADADLHSMLINNCGNKRLEKMINKYSNYYLFYRIVDLSHLDRAKESYFTHFNIFQAVKERDKEEAGDLMAEHIKRAKNVILQNFDEYTFGY